MKRWIAQKPTATHQWLLVGLVLFYLGGVLGAPLLALVGRMRTTGEPPILTALADEGARQGLLMSVGITVLAVVIGTVFGIAAALVLVRSRFIGRRLLDALIDLPLAVSPVMAGLAFLILCGRGGWLTPVLDIFGVRVPFAFGGVLIATLFVTVPFVVREVEHVLTELGTSEEEAAATLGASRWQTFWRVTLPNIRYAVGYGVVLTAARSYGEFGAVLVLGGAIAGKTQTATTFIFTALDERQEAAAYGMALILAMSSIALLMTLEFIKKLGERTARPTSGEGV